MEIRQPNPENLTNVTTPPQTPPQSTLNQHNVHRFKALPIIRQPSRPGKPGTTPPQTPPLAHAIP